MERLAIDNLPLNQFLAHFAAAAPDTSMIVGEKVEKSCDKVPS